MQLACADANVMQCPMLSVNSNSSVLLFPGCLSSVLALLLSGPAAAVGRMGRLGPGLASVLPDLTAVDKPDQHGQAAIAAAAGAGQTGHVRQVRPPGSERSGHDRSDGSGQIIQDGQWRREGQVRSYGYVN